VALVDVTTQFLTAPEYAERYGVATDNDVFLDIIYLNVLDRTPDQEGRDFWSKALSSGVNRSDIMQGFSESAEHSLKLAAEMSDGMWYV
jgi:hypothetical protein